MFWGGADVSLEAFLLTALATLALVVLRPTAPDRGVEADRDAPLPAELPPERARASEPAFRPWPRRLTPPRTIRTIHRIRPRHRRAA
jgi:hypothetical protein